MGLYDDLLAAGLPVIDVVGKDPTPSNEYPVTIDSNGEGTLVYTPNSYKTEVVRGKNPPLDDIVCVFDLLKAKL